MQPRNINEAVPYANIYNENSYVNCRFYKLLQNPKLSTIVQIGNEFNKHFKAEIQNKVLPKYKRYQKRNLISSIWFFESILVDIYPWLKELGVIQSSDE